MKKHILFLDPSCRTPYSYKTLESEAMGGTEATVVRLAEAVAAKGHEATVIQHNREADVKSPSGVLYTGLSTLDKIKPTHAITLRSPRPMPLIYDRHPKTKQYLWLHDLTNPTDDIFKGKAFYLTLDTKPQIVCVSRFHLDQVKGNFLGVDKQAYEYIGLKYIHNPIADDLKPRPDVKRDSNKLVFFSSPHKNIKQVLSLFQHVRQTLPELKLYVANPGYEKTHKSTLDNVVTLGKLKHKDMMQHVAEALCVFMPQHDYTIRETFGIVFAEANALGTPVLAHNMGAAPEVLGSEQVIDCRDPRQILGRLEKLKTALAASVAEDTTPLQELGWTDNLERFRMSEVVEKWLEILE